MKYGTLFIEREIQFQYTLDLCAVSRVKLELSNLIKNKKQKTPYVHSI